MTKPLPFTDGYIVRATQVVRNAGLRVTGIGSDGTIFAEPRDGLDVQTRSSPPAGFVYFISDGEFVKIGFSLNPKNRLAGLQTSSPRKLRMLHTIPGSTLDEAALHMRYAEYRQQGEWFRVAGDLAVFLAGIGCPQ